MPKALDKQLAFTSGEVGPAFYARLDLAKFNSACRILENMIVHVEGGSSNRPGLAFIGEVNNSTKITRLIPFRFNTLQAYGLEFSVISGSLNMRVIRNGGYITLVPSDPLTKAITGLVESQLADIKFTQSADVLTMTHPDWLSMYNVTRTDHDAWTITQIDFGPVAIAPSNLEVTANTANPGMVRSYVVTAIDEITGEESLASTSADVNHNLGIAAGSVQRDNACTWAVVSAASQYNVYCDDTNSGVFGFIGIAKEFTEDVSIFGITNASIAELGVANSTTGPHAYVTEQPVSIAGVVGMTGGAAPEDDLNAPPTYLINNVAPFTIGLKSLGGTTVDTSAWSAYVSGGIATISNLFSFKDNFISPDYTRTPPETRKPFSEVGETSRDDTPRCLTYHQQRRIYGGPNNAPSTWFASRIGLFTNMNVSQITQGDDAITFNVVASDVHEIRDMKSAKELFLFTSSGIWRLSTGDKIAFVPENLRADEQSSIGVSDIRVLSVGNSFLYIEDGERVVRDLQDVSGLGDFGGNDLTLLASHMFKTRKIKEWAYARSPDSILWCVMDDGTLNALTYVREQQVFAWHRHVTEGDFESVIAIPESTEETGVYFIVKHNVNGVDRRDAVRLANRNFTDVRDLVLVDFSVSLDVPIVITGITNANPIVVTTTTATLSDGDLVDLSDVVEVEDADNQNSLETLLNNIRYKVANKTATTISLTDEITGANINGVGFPLYKSGGNVRKTETVLSGLGHLEGETVAVIVDGEAGTSQVVSGGSVTLFAPASRIHIGLGYVSTLETIGVDLTSVNGLGDSPARKKNIPMVKIRLQDSGAPLIGRTVDDVKEYKDQNLEPQDLINGIIEMGMASKIPWDHDATIVIKQDLPIPLTVLSIMSEVDVVSNR